MQIKVNGTNRTFSEENLTIADLLEKMKYSFPRIIVKYKDKIISKNDFKEIILTDNDEILIIHMISGG